VERLCVTLSIKRGCQPPHISGKVLLGIELPSGAKRQSEMEQRLEGKIVRDKLSKRYLKSKTTYMKTELENLLKELKSKNSEAEERAEKTEEAGLKFLPHFHAGSSLAYEFAIDKVNQILNDKRSVDEGEKSFVKCRGCFNAKWCEERRRCGALDSL